MPVAGITGIGHQDLVPGVHQHTEREQEGARCSCGDYDPRRGHRHTEPFPIVIGNGLAQLRNADRSRVTQAALADRLDRGFRDQRRCRKVRLADLHVNDAPSRSLQLMRAVLHVHHMEGFDVGHAGREDRVCVTLHRTCRRGDKPAVRGSSRSGDVFLASAHYAAACWRGCEGAAAPRNSAIMRPSNTRTSSREFPMDEILRRSALEYHLRQPPGKISVTPTKGLLNQRDLALAYTPGVAAACEEIVREPAEARKMTSRGNLIGVVTNGTAVLGLGAIGPLAAKPVMEGKAVLFKKFAGIDCFDIEVNERDPEKLVEIIAALEPTFGGINLEDIKAPECFIVERKLRERMKIPVFHDDQHGTAIIVSAAVLNGLKLVGKQIGKVKVAVSGAGAAALACLDLLVALGLKREAIFISDINDAMKIAAVTAIAELARAEASDIVASAYGGQSLSFGRDYLIPRPFDPRLIERIAPAVAKAAMDSGVATRPLASLEAYRERMARFAYHSGNSMKPVFEAAKASPKRVIYAEGEEERVLRAVQVIVDEGLARPVLVGRSEVIETRIKTLGLRLKLGDTCDVVNILSDPRYPG